MAALPTPAATAETTSTSAAAPAATAQTTPPVSAAAAAADAPADDFDYPADDAPAKPVPDRYHFSPWESLQTEEALLSS